MINKITTFIPSELRIKALMLIAIFLLYAFFSSSTPDSIGIPEILIGILLVLFVGISLPIKMLREFFNRNEENVLPRYVYISFLFLLIIPTIYGFIHGNAISNYIRDAIPFIYLFLPLFFLPHMIKNPDFWLKLLIILLSIVGVAYSVRFFIASGWPFISGLLHGELLASKDKNYFQQDPAVIFTSTYLLCLGLATLLKQQNIKNYFISFILLLSGLITFASLVASLVRGQIFLVGISVFIIMLIIIKEKKYLGYTILGLIMASILIFRDYAHNVLHLIHAKTALAGILNSRDAEMYAVLDNMKKNTQNFILGEGWGSTIYSPASGGTVRYVHNFIAYIIFKTGILGLVFISFYLFFILKNMFLVFKKTFSDIPILILFLSILNTFIINFLLEAGYKMFTFGILLTMLFLLAIKIQQLTNKKNEHNGNHSCI